VTRHRRVRRGAPEAGLVTAALAVALPALLLAAFLAVAVLGVEAAQLRALDAASVAARLSARGQQPAEVAAAAVEVAPGARLHLASAGGLVVADVALRVSLPGLSRLLPGVVVRERAAAPAEPGPPP
jgi:hypothetical protein